MKFDFRMEYSNRVKIPQLRILIHETERIIGREIASEEWEGL
jgi:hypothetical protein